MDQFTLHVRQAEVAALETEGEFGVFEAEQVQDGGVDVVGGAAVFDGAET